MLFEAETIDSIFYVSHHYQICIYIYICTGMYIIIYDICRYVEVHVEASVSVLIHFKYILHKTILYIYIYILYISSPYQGYYGFRYPSFPDIPS